MRRNPLYSFHFPGYFCNITCYKLQDRLSIKWKYFTLLIQTYTVLRQEFVESLFMALYSFVKNKKKIINRKPRGA